VNYKIPKSFQLFQLTYNVIADSKEVREEECLGISSYRKQFITLLDKKDDYISDDMKEQVFFHELIHIILAANGEEDLCNNEGFVDKMASSLHQFIRTSKGSY
jgi:hypothetical protein